MLHIIMPVPIIISASVLIIVNAFAFHYSTIDYAVIDLSIFEDVNALPMKNVV